jgi:hypothetical protein
MEEKEIRITIDLNGNIHREFVARAQPEVKKPRLLKKIVSTLNI